MDSSASGLPMSFTVNAGSDQSKYRNADLEPVIGKDLKALNTLSESPQDGVTRGAEYDLMVQLNQAFAQEREKNYTPASEQELADMLALSLMQPAENNQTTTLINQFMNQINHDDSAFDATASDTVSADSNVLVPSQPENLASAGYLPSSQNSAEDPFADLNYFQNTQAPSIFSSNQAKNSENSLPAENDLFMSAISKLTNAKSTASQQSPTPQPKNAAVSALLTDLQALKRDVGSP